MDRLFESFYNKCETRRVKHEELLENFEIDLEKVWFSARVVFGIDDQTTPSSAFSLVQYSYIQVYKLQAGKPYLIVRLWIERDR